MQLSHVLDNIATVDVLQHPRHLHRIIVFSMLWKNKKSTCSNHIPDDIATPGHAMFWAIAMSQNALPRKNMHRLIVIFCVAEKIK